MDSPRQVIEKWVVAFNHRDADAATALYHNDATNIQVAAGESAIGREAIRNELRQFFEAFPDNYTNIENLFEDGEWAIIEWSGGGTWQGEFAGLAGNGKSFRLQGCGFFHVTEGKIKFQRGYWDKMTWFSQLDIPID